MEFFVIALIIGIIPAMIAKSKGHSFFGWYVYGVLLFIIALVHAIILKPNVATVEESMISSGDMKKCPYCAELIKSEATICRFCNKDQPIDKGTICPDCHRPGLYYDAYNNLFCPHCQAPVVFTPLND